MSETFVQKASYTREEYLALEGQAEYRNEYGNDKIFAMAGETSLQVYMV